MKEFSQTFDAVQINLTTCFFWFFGIINQVHKWDYDMAFQPKPKVRNHTGMKATHFGFFFSFSNLNNLVMFFY